MQSLGLSRWLRTCSLFSLLLLAGCGGEKPVNIQGKVVFPASLKLTDTDNFEVRFVAEGKDGTGVASGTVKEATFKMKNLPAAKYKVVVRLTPYAGEKDSQKRTRLLGDSFNKKYDEKATPLKAEISATPPEQTLTIDLEKNTVSK